MNEQVQEQEVQEQETPLTKKIPLVEAFGPTVQGEGHVIGQLTYFLRFGLCDYKCRMCDSMHAVDRDQVRATAKWLTQDQIFDAAMFLRKARTTPWFTFSGGNPAIHDLEHLTSRMHQFDFRIAVETQGSYWNDWLLEADVVTVSPKGPGMGERLDLEVLDDFMEKLRGHPGLNMKVVVFDQRDIEIASLLYERYVIQDINRKPRRVYFHPDYFYLSLGNPYPPGVKLPEFVDLRNELIERYKSLLQDVQLHPRMSRVKFLPQLHVWLYGNAKGV
jgi:7-carboxy-7-deazaguanine synthase